MKSYFKRKKSFCENFIKTVEAFFQTLFSGISEPLMRWAGQLRRKEVLARMRKADIILASPKTADLPITALLYRIILGSQYIHSMLYIGDGKIIHTTARRGVVVGKVPRKIYQKDRYAIFRLKGLNKEKKDMVVQEALKWRGKKLNHFGLITNVPTRLMGFQKASIPMEKNRIW